MMTAALGGRLRDLAPASAAAEVGSIKNPACAASRQARPMASSETVSQRPPLYRTAA